MQDLEGIGTFLHEIYMEDTGIKIILIFTSFYLGACLGSFMQACSYRIPNGISIIYPGSSCPDCRHALRWYENIPIFGWFILLGKCKYCKRPIAFHYVLGETFLAILCLLLFLHYFGMEGDLFKWLRVTIIFFWFYLVAGIDHRFRVIPDSLTMLPLLTFIVIDLSYLPYATQWTWDLYTLAQCFLTFWMPYIVYKSFLKSLWMFFGIRPYETVIHKMKVFGITREKGEELSKKGWFTGLVILGLLTLVFNINMCEAPLKFKVLGACIGFIIMWSVRFIGSKLAGKEAMGLGDVKLVSAFGYLLGPMPLLLSLLIASFFAMIFGLFSWLCKGNREIPLGPFLALGAGLAYEWEAISWLIKPLLIFLPGDFSPGP